MMMKLTCYVALRRYEAVGWLRDMVGVSNGKDFPAEPSEEDFRLGLRSGIVLCNVLNKVNPGSVSKVKFLGFCYWCVVDIVLHNVNLCDSLNTVKFL